MRVYNVIASMIMLVIWQREIIQVGLISHESFQSRVLSLASGRKEVRDSVGGEEPLPQLVQNWKGPHEKECGEPLGAEGGLWMTASKPMGTSDLHPEGTGFF